MSTKYVLINGTVITGFAEIPSCGLSISSDGTIEDVFLMRRYKEDMYSPDTRIIDVQGSYITPGLIDTHLHGIGGYGTEDCSVDSILGMSERLADYGVTSFLPTIYTNTLDKMIAAEKAIVGAMGKEKGATIEGINLEGPFISPMRIGAQAPDGLQEVSLETWNKLYEAGEGKVVCMTVAPELKHMRSLALTAQKQGVILLAGHTDATYENIMEGIQCGILHTTHFFNAMSRLHHRNPGCVGAIMIQTDMKAEIICDGVHVHPELIKLLLREKPISNVVMVTDSLRPTGQKTGELTANGTPAVLSAEGAWVSAEDPNLFLGSALTLLKGVKNMNNWGIPLDSIVQMCASNPARIYNFKKKGALIPGNMADVAIISKYFSLDGLFIKGKKVRDNFSMER
ncbi:MAG: N-acetylglucosamine-6-phosphate deacetylase [Spirochaetales bacterium]|nr:N-acetylglucosamine-6-phosphate deacetylase [Spirochaetales bacterium]